MSYIGISKEKYKDERFLLLLGSAGVSNFRLLFEAICCFKNLLYGKSKDSGGCRQLMGVPGLTFRRALYFLRKSSSNSRTHKPRGRLNYHFTCPLRNFPHNQLNRYMPSLQAMARGQQKLPQAGKSQQSTNRKPAPSIFKSSEKVADSDLESDTESESGSDSEAQPAKASEPATKLNGKKIQPVARVSDEKPEEAAESDESSKSSSAGSSDESGQERETGSDTGSENGDGTSSDIDEETEVDHVSIVPSGKDK
jgi:hypothetical protein